MHLQKPGRSHRRAALSHRGRGRGPLPPLGTARQVASRQHEVRTFAREFKGDGGAHALGRAGMSARRPFIVCLRLPWPGFPAKGAARSGAGHGRGTREHRCGGRGPARLGPCLCGAATGYPAGCPCTRVLRCALPIAARYDIGGSPLREALFRLSSEQLVMQEVNRGSVSRRSATRNGATLSQCGASLNRPPRGRRSSAQER